VDHLQIAAPTAEIVSKNGKPEQTQRLMSLDALRGFDMFWLIGADALVASLAKVSNSGVVGFFADQLTHAAWEGFRFYDLIFPLFLFMVGISTVFSLETTVANEDKRAAYIRVLRRFAFLWFWAFIYSGGFAQEKISFAGVLQRISYCYLVTSLLFLNLRLRGLILVCVGILAGYWALMTFVPVPELGRPTFAVHTNWSNYLDRHYLPGEREERGWRNEGMLSTIPATATCLFGVFAGLLIKTTSIEPWRKIGLLTLAGLVLVACGYLWGLQFPIIKRIWTSSYVLVAGGYSCLLLAFFYAVIDVLEYRKWARPFVWIGANSLAIYLIAGMIPYHELTRRIVAGPIQQGLKPYDAVAETLVALVLAVLLMRFLYKREIFLRV
jgi:predicted acyltransferase